MNTKIEHTNEMSKLQATIWFWSVVGVFAVIWVLLPSLFHTGYKSDIIELQFIGPEWVLATRKHPMLPAWILETLNILTCRAFAAPFIATALCTIITLFAVWRLARQVLSERLALIGTFAMLPSWAITVEAVKFNQNSVLLVCWTLTVWTFYNAFQTNKQRWWIAAGLTLGLGLHAKYPMVLLALTILLYSLWVSRFRRYWQETGPWLTILVSFAVFLPHLIWLYHVDFWTTILYAAERQKTISSGISTHFYAPANWIAGQFCLIFVTPLLLLIPCLGLKWKALTPQSAKEKETRQYLLCCMVFPFFVMLLLATVAGINIITAYGYPFWFFLGVYLLLRFQQQDNAAVFRQTFCWSASVVLVLIAVFVVRTIDTPLLTAKPRESHYPMRDFGVECDRIWSEKFPGLPCSYISGDWLYAGNAAYTMKDRPHVHFYWENIADINALPTGTWSTDEDVNQKGGIILWNASEPNVPDWVYRRFPRAEVLPEILELPYKTSAKIPPLRIGIAIVSPSGTTSSHE